MSAGTLAPTHVVPTQDQATIRPSRNHPTQAIRASERTVQLGLATPLPFAKLALGEGLIGLVGVAMLWTMVRAGITPVAANAAQLAMTLGLNYCYNGAMTRHGRSNPSPWARLWRFGLTRGSTQWLSGVGFVMLANASLPYPTAAILCLAGTTAANYLTSRYLVFGKPRPHK